MSSELQTIVDGTTVERVLLDGNLQNLTAAQRVSYYGKVCESLGLNPLTRPFEFITLNGKLTLYARREATEQIRKLHHVSLTIIAREVVEDCYIVTARATLPDGRTDESIGVKSIAGLKGEARSNALMTAETKAKRRVTLSICGLGMLDETEVADIPAPAKVDARLAIEASPALKKITPEAAAAGDARWAQQQAESDTTISAPPPVGDELLLANGYVRVMRVSDEPTKNENVRKYSLLLSTGEEVTTINSFLASVAKTYCEDRTPVRIKTRRTKWGTDVLALMTQAESETKPEPPPTSDDIPFLWLLPLLLAVGSYVA